MTSRWRTTFHGAARPGASTAVSVVVHAVIIGAAVLATAAPDVAGRVIADAYFARFLVPPDRAGGQEAQREMIRFVSVADAAPTVPGAGVRPVSDLPLEPSRPAGTDSVDAPALPPVPGSDSVFTMIEVDSAATRYAWSAAPAYPKIMLDQNREGTVRAQWVVDEMGYADTTSLRILAATTREFADAVREALPFMRFSPAKMGAKPVRQLVEQEFQFRITKVLAGSGTAKKPEP